MNGLTFKDAQRLVDEWIGRFEEGYWRPLEMLAALVEEVGELARGLNSLSGAKKPKPGETPVDIAMELGDIIFSVICIANYYGINLEEAFTKVIEKYDKRDAGRWTPKRGVG